jgi:hypothetical protein
MSWPKKFQELFECKLEEQGRAIDEATVAMGTARMVKLKDVERKRGDQEKAGHARGIEERMRRRTAVERALKDESDARQHGGVHGDHREGDRIDMDNL